MKNYVPIVQPFKLFIIMKTKHKLLLLLLFLLFSPSLILYGQNTLMARNTHVHTDEGNGDPRNCIQAIGIKCGETRRFTENFVLTPSSLPIQINQIEVFGQSPYNEALQISNVQFELVYPMIEPHFNQQYYQALGFNLPAVIQNFWESSTGKVYINVIFDVYFCDGSANIPPGMYDFTVRISGSTQIGTNSSDDEYPSTNNGFIIGEYEEYPIGQEDEGPFVLENDFGILATFEVCGYPNPPLIPTANTSREFAPDDLNQELEVSLYPNPSKESTLLQVESRKQSLIEIAILDLQGRKLLSIPNQMMDEGMNTIKLNLTGLADGLYLVQLRSGVNTHSLRLVKN